MIELNNNSLLVSFPEVHPLAKMTVTFEKAFRAELKGEDASSLSTRARFPLKHIDDYAEKIPTKLLKRGGIILPMRQSEALAIHFMPHKAKTSNGYLYENDDGKSWYPFIVKVGCGLVNAVSGGSVKDNLSSDPQNYLFIDEPTTLYGMNDKHGQTHQFVASPLGRGVTVEEQLTGKAEYGGIQLIIYPIKKKAFEEYYFAANQNSAFLRGNDKYSYCQTNIRLPEEPRIREKNIVEERHNTCFYYESLAKCFMPDYGNEPPAGVCESCEDPSMGISYGERICSTFNKDIYEQADWDKKHYSRCFAHILNSEAWREITGENPETDAITEEQYRRHGLIWKQNYNEY